MGSAQILSHILIISAVCFISTSALAIPARFREQLAGDEVECTKKIIEFVANEDSGKLSGFHGKSDFEKVKALWLESRQMFRNGNNFTKHFEEGMTHAFESDGGDTYVEQILQDYVKNATAEMKDVEITSCLIASIFEAVYGITKSSMSSGRLGHSDTFLPMVKDIIMSIDPKSQTFIDSPPAIFASGFVFASAVPDFILSALTLVTYIPDNVLEQFIEEFPKAIESFDPTEYTKAMHLELME